MNNPKQLIILGGGSSIKEGLSLGLWDKIKEHFVVGTNYSYKFFDSTLTVFVDSTFYNNQKIELERLPMIIGQCRNIKVKLPNTLAIPANSIYTRDLKGGIHSAKLSGIYALALSIYLLDIGEIYLLGYDLGAVSKSLDDKKRPITHWYQNQTEHRGVGKISYYDAKDRGDKDFGCFKNEKDVKIFNVSLKSKINVFPKISYEEFFKQLNEETFNQDELRLLITTKLKGKYK
jgi:hypothetical protein